MFRRILYFFPFAFVALVVLGLVVRARSDEPIADPIADYLAMSVPNRISNVGHLPSELGKSVAWNGSEHTERVREMKGIQFGETWFPVKRHKK